MRGRNPDNSGKPRFSLFRNSQKPISPVLSTARARLIQVHAVSEVIADDQLYKVSDNEARLISTLYTADKNTRTAGLRRMHILIVRHLNNYQNFITNWITPDNEYDHFVVEAMKFMMDSGLSALKALTLLVNQANVSLIDFKNSVNAADTFKSEPVLSNPTYFIKLGFLLLDNAEQREMYVELLQNDKFANPLPLIIDISKEEFAECKKLAAANKMRFSTARIGMLQMKAQTQANNNNSNNQDSNSSAFTQKK